LLAKTTARAWKEYQCYYSSRNKPIRLGKICSYFCYWTPWFVASL